MSGSAELIRYLRDVRFWIPAAMLLGFELFLQSGLYGAYMLEKYSYADSIRRNVRIIENSPIHPDALILGTSVAYQGIHVPRLNESLKSTGVTVQSAACEGCMLQTQHLLYRKLKDRWPQMGAIVHVADTTLSSKARYQYDLANGSMMAQLARGEALELLRAHEFDVGFRDYVYFHVRLVTYQQDLREFVLNPFSRIRTISQRLREPLQPITHINDNAYTYASFTATGDLAACVQNSAAGVDDQGRPVPEKKDGEKYEPAVHRTDRHHRHAVTVTCDIALREKNFEPPGETQWRDLYFRRLQRMYDEIYADGRLVITIIPPYSDLIHHANTDERIARWKKRIAEINAGRPYALIDMRRSLNSFDSPEGRHYFYDVLHLNAAGSLAWTEQMASELARHRNLITLNSRGSVQQTR